MKTKIDWGAVYMTVEILYPVFRNYVKEYRGFLVCPKKTDIKLWYDFQRFIESAKLNKGEKKQNLSGEDKRR